MVVGVMYRPEWYGEAAAFEAELKALAGLDDRIEVFVETYDESHEVRTGRSGPDVDAWRDRAPALTEAQREAFARVEVALAIDLPFDVATHAPNLRWVQGVGAGTGQLQSAGLAAAGIVLTSSAGSNAVAIAEFVLGRILQEWKRFRELDAAQRDHHWGDLYGQQLEGATVGLIGLGAINSALASRLRAFGVRVLATRRSATAGANAPDVDVLFPVADLMEMLPQCDIVAAAVPGTAETAGLMDRAAFAAMKPGAFFVNVGRGTLVDEDALVDALTNGHLRAAALDVTRVEPLPADSPLWSVPNLYLSPHASSSPAALFVNLHRLFADNLLRYLAGQPLRNEVAPVSPS